jgi:hypothetical protein
LVNLLRDRKAVGLAFAAVESPMNAKVDATRQIFLDGLVDGEAANVHHALASVLVDAGPVQLVRSGLEGEVVVQPELEACRVERGSSERRVTRGIGGEVWSERAELRLIGPPCSGVSAIVGSGDEKSTRVTSFATSFQNKMESAMC